MNIPRVNSGAHWYYVQRVLENLTIYGFRFENGFLPELIVDAMIGSEPVDYH